MCTTKPSTNSLLAQSHPEHLTLCVLTLHTPPKHTLDFVEFTSQSVPSLPRISVFQAFPQLAPKQATFSRPPPTVQRPVLSQIPTQSSLAMGNCPNCDHNNMTVYEICEDCGRVKPPGGWGGTGTRETQIEDDDHNDEGNDVQEE